MRRTAIPASPNCVSVLGYHNIGATWRFGQAGSGGRAAFARQLRFLRRTSTLVALDEAVDALRAGRPLPPRAVAITFDDGYRDNLTTAAPLLRRFRVPATMFLVPGFLSGKVHAWWERLGWAVARTRAPVVEFEGQRLALSTGAERRAALASIEDAVKWRGHADRMDAVERLVAALEPEGSYRADELFMTWDEARDLVRAGISIGSHTLGHAILSREPDRAQYEDLDTSRRLLEDGLGTEVRSLAYPNGQPGDYDDRTVAAARAAGYSHAVAAWGATSSVATPRYEIRRRMVSTEIPAARLTVNILRDLVRPGARG